MPAAVTFGASAPPSSAGALVPVSSGLPSAQVVAATAPSAPSLMRGRTVDQVLRMWRSELEHSSATFQKQALAVNEWDIRLLHNKTALVSLERESEMLSKAKSALEEQIATIEAHQDEMVASLNSIESQASEIFESQFSELMVDQHSQHRDSIFVDYGRLQDELQQVEHTLAQAGAVVEDSDEEQQNSTLKHVQKIMTAQYHSLMGVDRMVEELLSKLNELTEVDGMASEVAGPTLRYS